MRVKSYHLVDVAYRRHTHQLLIVDREEFSGPSLQWLFPTGWKYILRVALGLLFNTEMLSFIFLISDCDWNGLVMCLWPTTQQSTEIFISDSTPSLYLL